MQRRRASLRATPPFGPRRRAEKQRNPSRRAYFQSLDDETGLTAVIRAPRSRNMSPRAVTPCHPIRSRGKEVPAAGSSDVTAQTRGDPIALLRAGSASKASSRPS